MKTNKGFAGVSLLIFLVALVAVGGVVYFSGKGPSDVSSNAGKQNTESTKKNIKKRPSKFQTNKSTESQDIGVFTDKGLGYSAEPVYITGFEKKEDGNYYLTFTPNYWNSDSDPGQNIPITSLVPPGFKVITDYNGDLASCPEVTEDFASYQLNLRKELDQNGNVYYWNPFDTSTGNFDGYYEATVDNGVLIELRETSSCGWE